MNMNETHPEKKLLVEKIPDIIIAIGYLCLTIASISFLWKTSINPIISIRNISFIIGFACVAYAHYIIVESNHSLSLDGYFSELNNNNSDVLSILKFGNLSILLYATISIIHKIVSNAPDFDVSVIQENILSKHKILGIPIDAYGMLIVHGLLIYAIYVDTAMNVSLPFHIMIAIMLYNTYHTYYDNSSMIKKISLFGSSSIAIGYAGVILINLFK
jgi:hypothetical protein